MALSLNKETIAPLSTNQICILYFKIYCHVIHSIIFIRYFENLALCMSSLKSLLTYFVHKLSSKSLENKYSYKYKIQYSNHIFDSSHSITYMLYKFIHSSTYLLSHNRGQELFGITFEYLWHNTFLEKSFDYLVKNLKVSRKLTKVL